ncbi:SpaA isopeptide-forming pilin-related protein [Salibacterium lacus]|uniref:SpaA isopeptide-forming pilin-related protein n=1 Tax=Salibacterium lacus TaxID=1898109 RepID=A0ABW5T5Z4_9BACI
MVRKLNISAIIFILIFQLVGSGAGLTSSVMAQESGDADVTAAAEQSGTDDTQTESSGTDNQTTEPDTSTETSGDTSGTNDTQDSTDSTDGSSGGDDTTQETNTDEQTQDGNGSNDSTDNQDTTDDGKNSSGSTDGSTDGTGSTDGSKDDSSGSSTDETADQSPDSGEQNSDTTVDDGSTTGSEGDETTTDKTGVQDGKGSSAGSEMNEQQAIEPYAADIKDKVDNPSQYLDSFNMMTDEGEDVLENGIDSDSEYEAQYQFSFGSDHSYGEGTTLTFNVPEEFEVYEQITEVPISFGEQEIGSFTVTEGGEVTVTFTDNIEGNSVDWNIKFQSGISSDQEVNKNNEIEVTPIEGGDPIFVPVNLGDVNTEMSKTGEASSNYNADTADWTVRFNKSRAEITNPVFKDTLGDNMSLQEDTLQVNYLNLNADGTWSIGDAVNVSSPVNENGEIEMNLGADTSRAYQVTYTTNLEGQNATEYENNATLSGNSGAIEEKSGTVTTKRGKPLEKVSSNYDSSTQTIEWTIRYNYNQQDIPANEASISDTLSHEGNTDNFVMPDNVTVEQVDSFDNSDGSAAETTEVSSYKYSSDTTSFNLDLAGLTEDDTVSDAYKITYTTEASDRVINSKTVTNSVSSNYSGHTEGDEATVGVEQGIIGKSNPDENVNYQNKTVDWTITLNKDDRTMTAPTITDTMQGGFTLQEDSIEVSGYDDNQYSLTTDSSSFTIKFNDGVTVNQNTTIEYTTDFEFNPGNNESFENDANVKWSGGNQSVSREFNPNNNTKDNGFKNGSYNAENQTITWNIGVNYDTRSLNNVEVTDTVKGNQQLQEGTIEVYNVDPGVTSVDEISKKPVATLDSGDIDINASEDEFTADFGEREITDFYLITYKTSLDGLNYVQDTYSNDVTVTTNDTEHFNTTATEDINYGGGYAAKSGNQPEDSKIVDWKVVVNGAQADINNVQVEDSLTGPQMLLTDTIKVYNTNVAADGTVTKDSEITEDETYEMLSESEAGFKLDFIGDKNNISSPYIIEYQSYIQTNQETELTNDLTVSGEEVEEDSNNSGTSVQTRWSSGEGSGSIGDGSGDPATLTINKQDVGTEENNPATGGPINGVEFTLIDPDSGVELMSGVTGEGENQDGQIVFNDVVQGTYELREDSAPERYKESDSPRTINVEGTEQSITIENELKNPKSIKLEKVDADTEEIIKRNAVFNVEKQNGDLIREGVKTGEDGTVTVENLTPGNYQFVETTPPTTYQKAEDPVEFTIEDSQEGTKTVEVANSLIQGSVQLTKVDTDTPDITLAGAVFEIYKEGAEEPLEINGKDEFETGENGKIVVENLDAGTYEFVETESPEGYKPNEEPEVFTIKQYETVEGVEQETVTVENELYPGSVQLIKTEQNNPDNYLEGAVFELQTGDGETLEEGLTTNENGRLTVNELAPGQYQFIETEAPYDYWRNTDTFSFEIEEGGNESAVVRVENSPLPDTSNPSPNPDPEEEEGSVVLTKTAEDTDEALEGAAFDLEDSGGDVIEEDLTTDADGEIEVTGLEPGDYEFVETEAPEGYILDDSPVDVEIQNDEETTVTVTNEPANEQTEGSVLLTKTNSSEQPSTLQGAVFNLENDEGEVVQEGLTTNEDGEISVTGLEPGDYQFVETEAPNGYEQSDDPLDFTIVEGQQEAVTLTAENEAQPGTVQLTKTAADDSSTLLEDAVFTLEQQDGTVVEEGLTTGAAGTVTVSNLEPGDYQFIETKAPEGYEQTSDPAAFTMEAGSTGLVEVTVENEKSQQDETTPPEEAEGSVALTKVDETDGDELLEGAVFTLQTEEGTVVEEGLTTNSSGKIFVNNLEPGTYEFVETKAPEGYKRNNSPVSFTIEADQSEAVSVLAENVPSSNDTSSDENPSDENVDTPTSPGDDKEAGDSADGREEDNNAEKGQALPDTSTSTFNYGLAGIIALLAGLFIRRRRKV